RTLVVAGMGEPGRFGVPELTVLVRELCWSLGRMGKKHLATVLIGAGRDNLSVADAVDAWVRGLKLAISGVATEPVASTPQALQEITFYLNDPRKLILFDKAIVREVEQLRRRKRMYIAYDRLSAEQIEAYADQAFDYLKGRMARQRKLGIEQERATEPAPSRITVSVEGDTYRFGAVTDYASIPEREIPLDPALVSHANDELAAEADTARQLDLGRFMQRLLIPADLRGQLATNAPLIMMLDRITARIHWELLALSDLTGEQATELAPEEPHLQFLGTSRGFTRQLRTVHAPPPEPPPPPQRHLRVLVVADPAADAHLPGAEEEGIAVADLFEQFNIVHAQSALPNRVEVVRLFGPREATRTTVLRHLMMRTYDVLHFAGHCVYDAKNPAKSGWIFSNGERLSAYEFTRIDRSPAFVFSNACESGVTPARSDDRSVDLAPSFAEAFFARGVTNFVCTAWPVDDRAARDFALTLYAGLLGLEPSQSATDTGQRLPQSSILHSTTFQPAPPLAMHQAMMRARRAIAVPPSDIRTWGAYQHYGNPYFRFFDPAGMLTAPPQESETESAVAEKTQEQKGNATVVSSVAPRVESKVPSNGTGTDSKNGTGLNNGHVSPSTSSPSTSRKRGRKQSQ
ncbi:MAG: CHAT domain-containing protein, partial [Caldilineaceae bacterium]|nr:CHAT domain-containing protein [Caldilineaceae bacterium]